MKKNKTKKQPTVYKKQQKQNTANDLFLKEYQEQLEDSIRLIANGVILYGFSGIKGPLLNSIHDLNQVMVKHKQRYSRGS